jgi:hypothetical protein
MGPKENVAEVAKSALDKIRIVPNPYLAYSAYEKSAADTRVKITNLPNICTITVYALDGTLIRTISVQLTQLILIPKQAYLQKFQKVIISTEVQLTWIILQSGI